MDSTNSPNSTRRLVVLAAVCMAALALPLTFSGGAVATPSIGRDLGGGPVAMNWITNAFMLAFGSLLMAAGTLADRFGRKRVFACGVAGFTLTSLALGFAPSIVVVDLLRAAQGVAAAAALAGGTAALAQEFDGHARTRAFSALGTTFGIGLAFGPVLAGWLIAQFDWRAIFATGAVAGALSLGFGVPRMRESRDPHARQLDWVGTVTFTAALTCFTCGVIEAPSRSWSSAAVVGLLAASVAFAVAFIVVESRVARPMLDLSLFRYPRFVGVQVLPIATCYCYIVLLVVLPLRFIGVDGYDEVHAGWLMLALSAPMLVVPVVAATLTRWMSAGAISGIGLVIAAAGLYALAGALHTRAGASAIGPMLAIGIGAGMPWGLMDGLSVSVVPKSRAGMATGIFSTTRVAGEGVALAVVSALLAALAQGRLRAAIPHAEPAAIADAAARLATGDLAHAAARLPDVARATLQASYHAAFGSLLDGLTVVTLLCAIAAFAFLSRVRVQDAPFGAEAGDAHVAPSTPTADVVPPVPELARDDH
ncbi:MFS transporter [Paraburkholderia sp. BL25I1N1]|uniref:MFS transporter n=1 Tax=Paraburkholderia sp. BL25I1N1 TaxID=1938804 RepID=UPI000D052DF3|nr:MFS transporter [Paraburkholderia sp. BL25I1N1]PRY04514.1 MFS transporter [Paraburkholderia sp. BL25I1N1]